jgi:hypothetical protein
MGLAVSSAVMLMVALFIMVRVSLLAGLLVLLGMVGCGVMIRIPNR